MRAIGFAGLHVGVQRIGVLLQPLQRRGCEMRAQRILEIALPEHARPGAVDRNAHLPAKVGDEGASGDIAGGLAGDLVVPGAIGNRVMQADDQFTRVQRCLEKTGKKNASAGMRRCVVSISAPSPSAAAG